MAYCNTKIEVICKDLPEVKAYVAKLKRVVEWVSRDSLVTGICTICETGIDEHDAGCPMLPFEDRVQTP